MADYIYTMETRLTPDQQKGVSLVQDVARSAGMNLYMTGGAVCVRRGQIHGFENHGDDDATFRKLDRPSRFQSRKSSSSFLNLQSPTS